MTAITLANLTDILPTVVAGPLASLTVTGAVTAGTGDITNLSVAGGISNFSGILTAASWTKAWPTSFGANPTSVMRVNTNNYSPTETNPAGTLENFTSYMLIPSSYNQVPQPPAGFASYIKSSNVASGNSHLCYFGFSGSAADGVSPYGMSVQVQNSGYTGTAGLGHDFGYMAGYEADLGIWTKASTSAPSGTGVFGFAAVVYADNSFPAAFAFECRLGSPASNPWAQCIRSEDGSATVFASIGCQTSVGSPTGNSVPSQSISLNSRNSGGTSTATTLQNSLDGDFTITPGRRVTITTSLAIGGSNLASSGVLWVHQGVNQNLLTTGPQALATGISTSAVNDAVNAFVPYEIRASQFCITGGSVGIGTGASAPTATLQVVGSGSFSSTLLVGGAITLTGQTSTPGALTGTLTNAPATGNAQTWLSISINGVVHFIPAWHV